MVSFRVDLSVSNDRYNRPTPAATLWTQPDSEEHLCGVTNMRTDAQVCGLHTTEWGRAGAHEANRSAEWHDVPMAFLSGQTDYFTLLFQLQIS
jgi:hypothetical protein